MMELGFGFFRTIRKQDIENEELVRDRLIRIRKTIETRAKLEDTMLEKPLDVNSLRRIFHLCGLWVVRGEKVHKFGNVNYSRELESYTTEKEKFINMTRMVTKRGEDYYYVLENVEDIVVFSTPLELANNDLYILFYEINQLLSPQKKSRRRSCKTHLANKKEDKAFLAENYKHKD
jgi:hypothetical protein